MNRRVFSLRLMKEGMRQIRLVGIIGLVLSMASSFGSTLLFCMDNAGYKVYYGKPAVKEFYQVNPYIVLVMYTLVPIMIFMLFGFMNKRKTSDFYHSIPYKRFCIYTSFFAAAFAWGLIIVFSGVIVTLLTVAAAANFTVTVEMTVKFVLTVAAGMLLVSGVICFAMTVTGTYFTNFMAALMFLFAPRGIISMCAYMLQGALPFVPSQTGGLLLNASSNIAYGMISYVIFGTESVFTGWTPVVYTFVLGLLYCAAGSVLFVARKSENATRASVNRMLQGFLRTIPAMLISLIPIGIIFTNYTDNQAITSSEFSAIIIAYIAAALVYFIYEAVTTRKLKNIVRAIPGLFIAAALNVILIFGLITDYNHDLKMLPEASELEYVIIEGPSDSFLWKQAGEVKLYSDGAKKVAVDCLKDTLDKWEHFRYGGAGSFYSSFYGSNCMKIQYHYADGTDIVRKVIVGDSRYAQMKKALTGEDKFVNAFNKGFSDMQGMDCQISGLDSQEAEAVYRTFLSEVSGYDFGRMLDIVNYRNGQYFFGISLTGRFSNSLNGYSYICVDANLPNTAAAYAIEINRKYPDNEVQKFMECVEEILLLSENMEAENDENSHFMDGSLGICLYTVQSDYSLQLESSYVSYHYEGNSMMVPDEEGRELLSWLAGYVDKANKVHMGDIRPGACILVINCDRYKEENIVYDYLSSGSYGESVRVLSDEEYGWYVVDKTALEMLRNILRINHTYY